MLKLVNSNKKTKSSIFAAELKRHRVNLRNNESPRPPDNQKNSFKALLGRSEAKDEIKTLTHPRRQKSNSMGFDKKRRQS